MRSDSDVLGLRAARTGIYPPWMKLNMISQVTEACSRTSNASAPPMQEEVEASLAVLGALDDGFHGADRLTIRQDGKALVLGVERDAPQSASLEGDEVLMDFSVC